MEKTLLYPDKKIFYRSIGTGKPVILVHGFGEDGSVWTKQADVLKKNYHLLIPDLPGSGQSEMIDDMSMEGLAEVIHSIIHKENLHDCTVIGHSMGGYITLALVESYHNHVSSFGLVHSTAFPDTEEKKSIRRKGIEFIEEHGAFEFLKTTTPNLFSDVSKQKIPGEIAAFIDSLKGFTGPALISYYNAMIERPDRTALLKNSKNPILFIAGEHDAAVPIEDSFKQAHLPEKCYFHVLKNSGHLGMIEEPKELTSMLEEFLREI